MENLTLYIGVASLVGSIVSIVLAVLAIGFSLYFYTKGKNSEIEVSKALVGIKAQTQALQKILGVQFDKLTDYAFQPREGQEELKLLLQSIQDDSQKIKTLVSSTDVKELNSETVALYITSFYYSAVSNYACQGYLRVPQNPTDMKAWAVIVDQSYQDYFTLDLAISKLTNSSVFKESTVSHLYTTGLSWKNFIKTSQMVFTANQEQ